MNFEPQRVDAKLVSRSFADDEPRQIVDPVKQSLDAAVQAAAVVPTPTVQETGELAQLGALRDLSWRQRESLPGMLAKRAMQGGAIGLVAYVLCRLLAPRAVRS